MLWCLGHTHPDISFATHQCERYNHSPKQSHEDALKRIGRYLKRNANKRTHPQSKQDYQPRLLSGCRLCGTVDTRRQAGSSLRMQPNWLRYLSRKLPSIVEKQNANWNRIVNNGGRIRCSQHLLPWLISANRYHKWIMHVIASWNANQNSDAYKDTLR